MPILCNGESQIILSKKQFGQRPIKPSHKHIMNRIIHFNNTNKKKMLVCIWNYYLDYKQLFFYKYGPIILFHNEINKLLPSYLEYIK